MQNVGISRCGFSVTFGKQRQRNEQIKELQHTLTWPLYSLYSLLYPLLVINLLSSSQEGN